MLFAGLATYAYGPSLAPAFICPFRGDKVCSGARIVAWKLEADAGSDPVDRSTSVKELAVLRDDIVVGGKFPDIALPDHTGTEVRLSEITRGRDPVAVIFYRGWY